MFGNYDASKYDPQPGFELPPEGPHSLTVEAATQETSKAGNAMIKASFSVRGYNCRIFHYFVDNEYIQKKLDQFFNAFGIAPGDFDLRGWIGRSGEAMVAHEEYNGKAQPRINYFVLRDEGGAPARPTPRTDRQDVGSLREEPGFEDDFPLDIGDLHDALDGSPGGNVDIPF
jgi:hypothetical protein